MKTTTRTMLKNESNNSIKKNAEGKPTATRTTQCYCRAGAADAKCGKGKGQEKGGEAACAHLGLNIKLSMAFSTINKK